MVELDEYSWATNISQKEWAEIRAIAGKLYDAGYFDRNQLKISVLAFLIWTQELEQMNSVEMPSAQIH